jgi:O-antigen/teichoic acid export membrane protein
LHFGLAATLGLLSLAAKLGEMALSLLATPIENIWGPFAYSVRNDHDGPRRIGQLFVRYVAFSLLVGVGVSLGAPLAIDLLAPAEYEIASDLVPIVAISCICFNVSCLSDLGILITKRTHLKPLLYGSAAVVAVIMQLLLTPRFGLFGAAVASALTSIFQLMSTHFVASRQYRFIVDQRAVLILVTGAGAAFLLGNYLQQPGSSVLVRLMAVSAGTAVILGAIFASRVLTWQDLMTLRQQYASRGRAATESAP